MKILMLGWELPPYNSGGLGIACKQLCKSLTNFPDINIDFIVPYHAEHYIDFMNIIPVMSKEQYLSTVYGNSYDSSNYINVYKNGTVISNNIYAQERLYFENISRVVKDRDFDIIHAHDWLTLRSAIKAKQLSGKKLIAHIHATEHDRSAGNGGNPFVKEIEYMGLMMADKIVAVSELTKKTICREYSIPADKVEVLHNGIDFDDMLVENSENAYSYITKLKYHGYKVILSLGRVTIMKGLYNLLLAIKEVVVREPKTILMLVGSGEQRNELINLAAELGISQNVIFVDFQRGKNNVDAFKIADLFVLPSVSEPFGLTALESIFYDTPVLTSKQTGVAEVLNNCLKVDYWDTKLMANHILGALRSEALRNDLISNSASELPNLTWEKTSHKLKSIYLNHIPNGAIA